MRLLWPHQRSARPGAHGGRLEATGHSVRFSAVRASVWGGPRLNLSVRHTPRRMVIWAITTQHLTGWKISPSKLSSPEGTRSVSPLLRRIHQCARWKQGARRRQTFLASIHLKGIRNRATMGRHTGDTRAVRRDLYSADGTLTIL